MWIFSFFQRRLCSEKCVAHKKPSFTVCGSKVKVNYAKKLFLASRERHTFLSRVTFVAKYIHSNAKYTQRQKYILLLSKTVKIQIPPKSLKKFSHK